MLAKLDRLQRGRVLKIIASVVVLLACAGAFVTYAVHVARERENLPMQRVSPELDRIASDMVDRQAAEAGGAPVDPARAEETKRAAAEALRENAETYANSINSILAGRTSLWAAGAATALAGAVLLAIVWLGLTLTFVGVVAGLAGVCVPMILWGSTWWRGMALFAAAVMILAWCFAALVQVARAGLSNGSPVAAIAQNVVNEAVRMKVSLVFVVLLILGLAALPGVLDSGSPLRYRVQAFLSYGVESSFWLIAVLVVFLSCATVAFEQRDKIIWQTMTKPVKPWEYVLGKWLGVMVVAGVLLGVSTGGVFVFTEYLHMQPAQGESRPFVPAGRADGGTGAGGAIDAPTITPDRLILETQVLTARASIPPSMPQLSPEAVRQGIEDKIKRMRQDDPSLEVTDDVRKRVSEELLKEIAARWLSVPPRDRSQFVFRGLKYAKEISAPVTLRFKVNAGSNMPTDTFLVTFGAGGLPPMVLETRLDQFMSQPLPPSAIQIVDDGRGGTDGVLVLDVWNGDIYRGIANKDTMTFPNEGLEVSYPVGSFRMNFARSILILWFKLGFLAIVGIAAATFLSFPVAALLAFGVLFCAEGAGFLSESLNSYDVMDQQDFLWWRVPIVYTARAVAWIFGFYVKLRPIENLAEGRVVTWLNVGTATVVFGGLTSMIWGAAAAIFRRRELATYSGQ
ncbi:MAG: ABC transporter permease [Phycisphaerales bacterium]